MAPDSSSTNKSSKITLSASQTTPIPPYLHTQLLSHLSQSSKLPELQSTLLTSLQRSGWTEKIRTLSLELLRSGDCSTFEEVLEVVCARAVKGIGEDATNGAGEKNGTSKEEKDYGVGDVRVPMAVVGEGVRIVREALEEVVVVEYEK